MAFLAYAIIVSPLISFFLCGLNGKSTKRIGLISIGFSLPILICSIWITYSNFNNVLFVPFFEFLTFPGSGQSIMFGFLASNLNCIMCLVVSIVSLMVIIYSSSYMSDDSGINRFMSYISLFTFFMLVLSTSGNLLQLFIGWEGVGLCSYLLINFWHKKKSANNAAFKAFLVNRFGDIAMILGMALFYINSGSLDISKENIMLISSITTNNIKLIDVIMSLFFIGAMTKSAQIFMHIWLPDAMEGPTPASALIHAATMVTAGVLLMIKLSVAIDQTTNLREVIVLVGIATTFLTGLIGLSQFDIKKIVAYSTCSQLGIMFIAIGTGCYPLAMFHLITHAFFKSLLFLSAGSVIHAMNGEQDIREMGGLRKKIPTTFILMLVGSIALCGIFPLSGFFSKDAIIESLYVHTETFSTGVMTFDFHMIMFFMMLISVSISTMYSFKIIWNVFFGKPKNIIAYNNTHESPLPMIIPMVFLAILSCISGFIIHKYMHIAEVEQNVFAESLQNQNSIEAMENIHHVSSHIKHMPTFITLLSIAISYLAFRVSSFYGFKKISNALSKPFVNKLWFDELYSITIMLIGKWISQLFMWFEKFLTTAIIGSIEKTIRRIGLIINSIQSSHFYDYISIGIIGITAMLIYVTRLYFS